MRTYLCLMLHLYCETWKEVLLLLLLDVEFKTVVAKDANLLLMTLKDNFKRNVSERRFFFTSLNIISGLILGLRPANERRRYFVTMSLIGWAQT